jgi:uncharacterized membrane protein
MAVCGKCGNELKSGAKFCKSCGSSQMERARHLDKRSRVLAGERRSGRTALVIGIVVVAVAAGLFFAVRARIGSTRSEGILASAKVFATITAVNGNVTIPLDTIAAKSVGYFSYATGEKEVKFFVLKAADGSIRVALDACNSCYRAKLGYHQAGDSMICNNCGLVFKSSDIGVIRGGCNPIPLPTERSGGMLVLKVKDLENGAKYF